MEPLLAIEPGIRAPNKTVAAGFSLRGEGAPVSRVGRDAAVVCGNGAATGESVLLGALNHRDTKVVEVPSVDLFEFPSSEGTKGWVIRGGSVVPAY